MTMNNAYHQSEIDIFTNDVITSLKLCVSLGNKECVIPWNDRKRKYWFKDGVRFTVYNQFYNYLTCFTKSHTQLVILIDPPAIDFNTRKFYSYTTHMREDITGKIAFIQEITTSTLNKLIKMIKDAVDHDCKSKKISKTFITFDTYHTQWNKKIKSLLKFFVKRDCQKKLSYEQTDPNKPNEVKIFIGTLNDDIEEEEEEGHHPDQIALLRSLSHTSFSLL